MRNLNLAAHFKILGIVAGGAISFVLVAQNATLHALPEPSPALAPTYERRVPLEQPRPIGPIEVASAALLRR